jgi:hypothetical protein
VSAVSHVSSHAMVASLSFTISHFNCLHVPRGRPVVGGRWSMAGGRRPVVASESWSF